MWTRDLPPLPEVPPGETPEGVDPVLWNAIEHWVPKRSKLAKRVQRQMLVLYCLLTFAFVLLAYRTETNSREIERGIWESCAASAQRAAAINPGRLALVSLLSDLVDDSPNLTDQQKIDARVVLKEGLVVSVANCGPRP